MLKVGGGTDRWTWEYQYTPKFHMAVLKKFVIQLTNP